MLCAVQLLYPLDGEEIGGYATDLCTHVVQQMTELLDIGLAGGVIDGGGAFGKDGSHHDVGSTCH